MRLDEGNRRDEKGAARAHRVDGGNSKMAAVQPNGGLLMRDEKESEGYGQAEVELRFQAWVGGGLLGGWHYSGEMG